MSIQTSTMSSYAEGEYLAHREVPLFHLGLARGRFGLCHLSLEFLYIRKRGRLVRANISL